MPSLLEYLSYNCNFMGILAGPTCSYNDYKAFIEGTGYQPRHQENANGKENGKYKQSEPSPKVQQFVPPEQTLVFILKHSKRALEWKLLIFFKPCNSLLNISRAVFRGVHGNYNSFGSLERNRHWNNFVESSVMHTSEPQGYLCFLTTLCINN